MVPHNDPRRAALPAAALLAVIAALAGSCGEQPAEALPPEQRQAGPPRPSLLLVVADSLHAARLSAWGHARPTSPRVEALADEGVRFTRAYSQSSWTLPSVASLFTSLEQERHGLRKLEQTLPPRASTLAELFASAGWRTHAVVQTPVLGSARGLDRGFDRYEVLAFGNEATEDALDRVARAFDDAGDGGLFVYLHLAPPHMPYQPPAPFRGRFSGGELEGAEVDGSITSCRGVHELRLAPDHPDVLRLAALYDEHVAFADDALGRLLDRIEPLPSARELLVVFTSDHGEAFGQHGAQGHNSQVFDEMLHVPLVVAGRGSLRVSPQVVDTPVSLLDLLPTLVERFGLPQPSHEPQGLSLAAALHGQPLTLPERALRFSSRYRRRMTQLELGLREGDLKLILSGPREKAELYDLARDPAETRDVAASRPDVAAAMEARLRTWYAQRCAEAAPAEAEALEPEVEAQLRALGYAGGR